MEGAIGFPYTLLWRFWTAEELVFAPSFYSILLGIPQPSPPYILRFFPYIMRPSPPYYILRFFLTFAPFPYPLHFAIFPFLYNERPSTPSYIVRPSPFFPFLLHCASFHSPTTIYHGHIAIWKRMFPTFLKPSLDIKDIIS